MVHPSHLITLALASISKSQTQTKEFPTPSDKKSSEMSTACARRWRKLLLPAISLGAGMLGLLFPSVLLAAQVTLGWNPNSSSIDGYRLYQRSAGQSYNYSRAVWSGEGTQHTVTGLGDGTQYYFVVRAYKGSTVSTNSNEVTYKFEKPQQAPTAEAGQDQTAIAGNPVTLDGSGSMDPEGQPLTFQWVQQSGPAVSLSAANTAWPTFAAPALAGDRFLALTFALTVSNTRGLKSTDTCLVHINPASFLDSDADGMSDDWEAQHGLDPSINDAGQDRDGDGISNLEEYLNYGDAVAAGPNQPPIQPSITYPVDGTLALGPNGVEINASAFSDPDDGDSHALTEWRIVENDSQHPVLQVTRAQLETLTALWLPCFVLDEGKAYSAQVRYFDQRGQASEWSNAAVFIAQHATPDVAPAPQEVLDHSDLNGNGVQDSEEQDVIRCIQTADGKMTGVEIEPNGNAVAVLSVGVIDPADLPVGWQDVQPGTLLGYKIQVKEPGQDATVMLHFADTVAPFGPWIAYGSEGDWLACNSDMTVQSDEKQVVRTLTDGGSNDADGVANGVIVDLVGRQSTDAANESGQTQNTITPTESGGGGGGCFIGSLFN